MSYYSAKPVRWAINPGAPREEALRIDYRGSFLVISWADARRLVDLVHDECDRHDRKVREANR